MRADFGESGSAHHSPRIGYTAGHGREGKAQDSMVRRHYVRVS